MASASARTSKLALFQVFENANAVLPGDLAFLVPFCSDGWSHSSFLPVLLSVVHSPTHVLFTWLRATQLSSLRSEMVLEAHALDLIDITVTSSKHYRIYHYSHL